MKPIRISQFSYHPLYIPLYVALEKGYFPFTLLFESKHNDDAVIDDIYKGKADFGVSDPVISEYEKYKKKVWCVGVFINRFRNSIITLDPLRKEIKSAKGLKGLRIGCYASPTTSYMLLKNVLTAAKLDIERDVEVIPIQGNRELGPLYSGDVEVCVVSEPIVSQAIANGAKVLFTLEENATPMAISGITCLRSTDKNTVQKFLSALQKGINDVFADEEAAVTVAQHYFPDIERKAILHAITQMKKAGFCKELLINEKEWQQAIAMRKEIEANKPYAYTNEFVSR